MRVAAAQHGELLEAVSEAGRSYDVMGSINSAEGSCTLLIPQLTYDRGAIARCFRANRSAACPEAEGEIRGAAGYIGELQLHPLTWRDRHSGAHGRHTFVWDRIHRAV